MRKGEGGYVLLAPLTWCIVDNHTRVGAPSPRCNIVSIMVDPTGGPRQSPVVPFLYPTALGHLAASSVVSSLAQPNSLTTVQALRGHLPSYP